MILPKRLLITSLIEMPRGVFSVYYSQIFTEDFHYSRVNLYRQIYFRDQTSFRHPGYARFLVLLYLIMLQLNNKKYMTNC